MECVLAALVDLEVSSDQLVADNCSTSALVCVTSADEVVTGDFEVISTSLLLLLLVLLLVLVVMMLLMLVMLVDDNCTVMSDCECRPSIVYRLAADADVVCGTVGVV